MRKAKQLIQNTFVLGVGMATAVGCHTMDSRGPCACSEHARNGTQAGAADTASMPQTNKIETRIGKIDVGTSKSGIGGRMEFPATIGQPAQPSTKLIPPAASSSYASVPEMSNGIMAHAQDYSWLEGTLEFTHSDSGRWKLRYAPLSAEDPFGGSVILDTDVRLERFQEGDVVHVEGELVSMRSSVYVSGPLYRIHAIRPIDSAQ